MNDMNNGQFDLNLLKVFLALYEEGSASRAATRLAVTQSAVSAALKRLRTTYNDQLFIRHHQGLQPTSKAHAIKPIIADAFEHFFSTFNCPPEGGLDYAHQSIIIGLSDDFELAFGAALTTNISARYPLLKVVFRQTNSQKVIPDLVERQIDIAITSSYLRSAAIHSDVLGYGNYACLVSREFRLADEEPTLSLSTYLHADHVLVSADGLRGIVDEVLDKQGLKRRVSVATTHFSALPFLLNGPHTLATLPRHAAEAISRVCGLRQVPCPMMFEDYPIAVNWHKMRAKDRLIADIIPSIKACFSAFPVNPGNATTDMAWPLNDTLK